ncbi:hypothetical protein [Futiania mangrovi]|uniref:Uncharacterized protein n=1 Tax=Futiania mangrovi TaxID=2959716 RepID=A0A9J6PC83_9PROT|nr:hypothetical protein [Futiania mangrovii]MCP1335219.1 hypothetical protein [Futiania mangrovii]
MSVTSFAGEPFASILNKGFVDEQDVLDMRRAVWKDGAVSIDEAEGLFAVDEACPERHETWAPMFVEAVVELLVNQLPPRGYLGEENARWLMERIEQDGHVKTATELEVLVRCLEASRAAPRPLAMFALGEVEHAVLHGTGLTRAGEALTPGVIGEPEVKLLRRVLYAAGGDGNIAITKPEAEVLFNLNDATAHAENHPSWSDLFVKAIANYLMFVSHYEPVSRADALRRDRWLTDGEGIDWSSWSVGGVLRELRGLMGVGDFFGSSDLQKRWEEKNREVAAQTAEAEKITADEAAWLADRIGRDGRLHPNEQALLAFLREEAVNLPPVLQPLLRRVA